MKFVFFSFSVLNFLILLESEKNHNFNDTLNSITEPCDIDRRFLEFELLLSWVLFAVQLAIYKVGSSNYL